LRIKLTLTHTDVA